MSPKRRRLLTGSPLALAALLSACAVGPEYHRPAAPMPAAWNQPADWREGRPSDALPKGEWWGVFEEKGLSALEEKALRANQTLQGAETRYLEARALAAVQIAALFPALGAGPNASRTRLSANRPPGGPAPVTGPWTENSLNLPFTASYEVDLFGKRRRSVEAARAAYQGSAADLENVRLLVTAEVASDYFSLRQVDTELGILTRTVQALQKGLELVEGRHAGGLASGLDVAQEETLLDSTRTQATLLRQERRQLEDALAVLVGEPAPAFSLPPGELAGEPPPLGAGLPSDLLERRPDIAEAERAMAAANAQVGVAKSAYFPSLNLVGSGGWQSTSVSTLVNAASLVWSIGATLAQDIFQGGTVRAQVQFSKAAYQESVANYRQTVLVALQEVQDSVTGLSVLEEATRSQAETVAASRRALDIAMSRYVAGLVSYLDVVNAQQNLLANEREQSVLQGERLVTSVLLVKALGGGWDSSSLASVQVKAKASDVLVP